MVDVTGIQSAISSLQTVGAIAKSLLQTNNAIDRQAKTIELQAALLDAQGAALQATTSMHALQDRLRSLEDELTRINAWGDQQKRYALVCPWRGAAQVYALRKDQANGEAAHFLCSNCFHGKKRTILNPTIESNKSSLRVVVMVCPACRATMDTGFASIGPPQFAEDCRAEE
jgi:hypothetical protein